MVNNTDDLSSYSPDNHHYANADKWRSYCSQSKNNNVNSVIFELINAKHMLVQVHSC